LLNGSPPLAPLVFYNNRRLEIKNRGVLLGERFNKLM